MIISEVLALQEEVQLVGDLLGPRTPGREAGCLHYMKVFLKDF